MRIAIISTLFGSDHGGSEEVWIKLGNELLKRGDELAVFLYEKKQLPQPVRQLQENGAALNFRKHEAIPSSLMGLMKFHFKRKVLKHSPYSNLGAFKPDLIYINQAGSVDAAIDQNLYEFLTARKIPYIIHIHQVSELSEEVDATILPRVQKVFTDARGLVFVSRRNKEVLFKKWNLSNNISWHLSGNPVNLASIEALRPPSDETFKMATVASINFEQKGQDILLRVLAGNQWRQRNWTWNIYGSGPDQEELKTRVKSLGLEGKVILKGFERNIAQIWKDNHAHVLPTRSEGMPMAVVESLLCGRPVMATDIGGIAEWVTEGENGFIAARPEDKALESALEKLWMNRQAFSASFQQVHEKARSQYNFDYLQDLLNYATRN